MYNSPPSIPTTDGRELAVPGRIQPPSPEQPLPLSHHRPAEAANKPQSRQEAPSTSPKDPRSVLDRADYAMRQMDRLDTWKGAVGRIKWVMDTLGPFAEVRVIRFDILG